MFRSLFTSRLVHIMIFTPRNVAVDKYGEHTSKDNLIRIPCSADGSESSLQGENGEKFLISYTVQMDKNPKVFPGDKISEIKTSQGEVLFTNGIIRRVTRLIDFNLGVIGQALSVEVHQ